MHEHCPMTEDIELSDEALRRIERLCDAATPGPWTSFVEGRDHESGSSFSRTAVHDIEMSGASTADQDFIASARQDVPRLLAEVRRLRALHREDGHRSSSPSDTREYLSVIKVPR